jgi:hypothetical protein
MENDTSPYQILNNKKKENCLNKIKCDSIETAAKNGHFECFKTLEDYYEQLECERCGCEAIGNFAYMHYCNDSKKYYEENVCKLVSESENMEFLKYVCDKKYPEWENYSIIIKNK